MSNTPATDTAATENPLFAAGETLLYRLQLFMSVAADKCANGGQPCSNHDGGTIVAEDRDWDNPSRCDVCGEGCECTRCANRTAVQDWISAEEIAKSDAVSLLQEGEEGMTNTPTTSQRELAYQSTTGAGILAAELYTQLSPFCSQPAQPMTLQQVAAFLAIAAAMHNRSEEVIQALAELQAEIFTQQK
jgi:hypothetical protein